MRVVRLVVPVRVVRQHGRPGVLHVAGGPGDPIPVRGDGPVSARGRRQAVPRRAGVPGRAGLRGGRRRRGRRGGRGPAQRGARLDGGPAGGGPRGAHHHVGARVRHRGPGHGARLAVPDGAAAERVPGHGRHMRVAARQDDGRHRRHDRHDVLARPPAHVRRVARGRQPRLGLRRRAAVLQAVREQPEPRPGRAGLPRFRRPDSGAAVPAPSRDGRVHSAGRHGAGIQDGRSERAQPDR